VNFGLSQPETLDCPSAANNEAAPRCATATVVEAQCLTAVKACALKPDWLRFSTMPVPRCFPNNHSERTPMSPVHQDEAEMLAHFGITRVPAYQYHYREWRYSNLDDAIAQAKRDDAGNGK
jgi:hypothetical protein